LGFFEQTAFPGKGLRGHCGVVHKGGSRSVQISCCSIQAGISLEQTNQACQVLPEEYLQL
jgi:hypothetical protein